MSDEIIIQGLNREQVQKLATLVSSVAAVIQGVGVNAILDKKELSPRAKKALDDDFKIWWEIGKAVSHSIGMEAYRVPNELPPYVKIEGDIPFSNEGFCARCGGALDLNGFCTDEDCQFFEHAQYCNVGWMNGLDEDECTCSKHDKDMRKLDKHRRELIEDKVMSSLGTVTGEQIDVTGNVEFDGLNTYTIPVFVQAPGEGEPTINKPLVVQFKPDVVEFLGVTLDGVDIPIEV